MAQYTKTTPIVNGKTVIVK